MKSLLSIMILLLSVQNMSGQIVNLPCQEDTDAFIGLDRKNWNGGSTVQHSEGYMHNFTLPSDMFGPCKVITNVEVQINIFNIDISGLPPDCPPPGSYYVNIYTGCPSTAPASCDPASNLIYENPNDPINTQTLNFTNPPETFDFGENFGVDIVPVMDVNCTNGQSAISSGGIVLDFEICVTVTVSDGDIDVAPELGAPMTVCPGSTIQLDPGNYSGYLWGPNGETSPTIDVGQGVYSVTVTDALGCTGTDDVVISSFPLPTITFDPATATACEGGTTSVMVIENYTNYAWSNSASGQSVSLAPGTYDVTVTDNNNCTNVASISVSSTTPPNAGMDNFIDVCNDGTTYNIEQLLISSDAGGMWNDDDLTGVNINAAPNSVSFANVAPGTYTYTYTVTGAAPCPDDDAVITVQVFDQVNIGTDAVEQFCTDPGQLDFNLLIGNPDGGGTWIDVSAAGVDISNPFSVNMNGFPPATYQFEYLLLDNGICMGGTTTLSITILDAANAGANNITTVCEGTSVNLLTLLSADANDGGFFIDSNASGALTGNIVNTTGLANQSYNFIYEVGSAGSACGSDQAVLTINIESSLSAGVGSIDTVCAGDVLNLFDFVLNEDNGGVMVGVTTSAGLAANILTTDSLSAGTFEYRYYVGDGLTCPLDSTVIMLTILSGSTIDFLLDDLTLCPDLCEDIVINLTGRPPYTFPLELYTSSGALIATDTVTSSDGIYSLSACNNGQAAGFTNDSLVLMTDENYFLTVQNLADSLCVTQSGTAVDTIFISTTNASVVQIDTLACITDTLDINGHLLFDGNDTAQDTFAGSLCDSIVLINVTFQSADTVRIDTVICDNASIMIGTVVYDINNPYEEVLTVNPGGCDSLTIIDVSFYPPSDSLINSQLCTGDFIIVDGTTYDESNPVGTEMLVSSTGCDSLIQIDLTFSQDITLLIDDQLCEDESIMVNGSTYDINQPMGQEMITGSGCDTTINIDLSFITVPDGDLSGTFCEDFSIVVNGTTYDINQPSGTETILSGSSQGCDSTVVIDLTFEPITTTPIVVDLCAGSDTLINGTTYDQNNLTGSDTLTNASVNGCDSIVLVNVNLLSSYDIAMNEQICDGDSIFLEGSWQFTAGTYVDNLLTSDLCDSIVTTTLTVIPCTIQVILTSGDNVCAGDSMGTIRLQMISDPVLPYTVSWQGTMTGNSGSISIASSQDLVDVVALISDTYTISVIDANGDIVYQEITTISDINPPLIGSWVETAPILCSGELGSIQFGVSGGSPGYSYLWNDATIGNTETATDIPAGPYTLTVTDINGCSIEDFYQLQSPDPLSFESIIMDPSCATAENGQISVTNINGGTEPYAITINDSMVMNADFLNLPSGSYTIVVSDDNNCEAVTQEDLSDSGNINLVMYDVLLSIVEGDSVILAASPLEDGLKYTWADSGSLSCADCSSPIASPLTTTTYIVTVQNEDGCIQEVSIIVEVMEEQRELIFPNIFSPNGDGINDNLVFDLGENRSALLQIFDRWGNLVHTAQSASGSISWDGSRANVILPNGVYVYVLDILSTTGDTEQIIGDVMISR